MCRFAAALPFTNRFAFPARFLELELVRRFARRGAARFAELLRLRRRFVPPFRRMPPISISCAACVCWPAPMNPFGGT